MDLGVIYRRILRVNLVKDVINLNRPFFRFYRKTAVCPDIGNVKKSPIQSVCLKIEGRCTHSSV